MPLLPALLYWVVMGSARHHFAHFSLPMLPAVALGVAWILDRCLQRRMLGEKVLLVVFALGALWPLAETLRWNVQRALPGTRTLATEWIEKNVPEGTRILSQAYGHRLAYTPGRAREIVASIRKENPQAGKRYAYLADHPPSDRPGYDFTRIPTLEKTRRLSSLNDHWYSADRVRASGAEWLVLTSAVYGRYLTHPDVFPRHAAFHDWLDRCSDEIVRFGPGNPPPEGRLEEAVGRLGPTIRILRLKVAEPSCGSE